MSMVSRILWKIFPKKPSDIERFKADVDMTYRGGWTPRAKIFILDKECCAISAACIANNVYSGLVDFVKKEYNLSGAFVIGFVVGFDGNKITEEYKLSEDAVSGYNLGVELHKKYFGEKK